jgi:hypothetical protein
MIKLTAEQQASAERALDKKVLKKGDTRLNKYLIRHVRCLHFAWTLLNMDKWTSKQIEEIYPKQTVQHKNVEQ